MRIYSVHADPLAKKPLETAVLVPEGFSIYAFIFNVFWALYHRLWWVALVLMLLAAGVNWLPGLGFSSASVMAIDLGMHVLLGLFAHDLRSFFLQKKGWITTDIVVAGSEMEATQRFYDRYRAGNTTLFQSTPPLAT